MMTLRVFGDIVPKVSPDRGATGLIVLTHRHCLWIEEYAKSFFAVEGTQVEVIAILILQDRDRWCSFAFE